MPKRKTNESSDSHYKTSTEPARDIQHGAVTRIEAKPMNKSNGKTLKSIVKKPIGEKSKNKTNTTKKQQKPQTQLNGQYWKGRAKSKAKVKAETSKESRGSKKLKQSSNQKKEIVQNDLEASETCSEKSNESANESANEPANEPANESANESASEMSSEEANDDSMSVEEESVSEMSQPETTQTESETEDEVPKKRVRFSKGKNRIVSTKYAELEQQLQQQQQFQQQFQQQYQQQFQQQQQQFLVLKDLLFRERDRVQDCETVIGRQQLRLDELPCSSKQSLVHDSFTSRKIPEFSGTGGEDEFESWKLRIAEFLKQPMFNSYSEDRKISTIKLGVCNTAAMVLEANSHDVHTVKDLIEVLGKVYGVDKKSSEFRAMQLEKESIRQYHARLKAYLVASGMVQDTDNFNNWMLKSFMEGVKPDIKVKLQAALPYDIEEAFRKAQTAEGWLLSQKVKKAETKALTSIEAEVNNIDKETVANINNNNNNNNNKSLNSSDNRRGFRGGFRGGFQGGFRGGRGGGRQFNNNINTNNNSKQAGNNNKNASNSNNNSNNTNNNNNYDQQRYISFQCFGCNKAGHRFNQCWSIDDAKKSEIQKNISSYLDKSKTDALNSAGGSQNSSQGSRQ